MQHPQVINYSIVTNSGPAVGFGKPQTPTTTITITLSGDNAQAAAERTLDAVRRTKDQ